MELVLLNDRDLKLQIWVFFGLLYPHAEIVATASNFSLDLVVLDNAVDTIMVQWNVCRLRASLGVVSESGQLLDESLCCLIDPGFENLPLLAVPNEFRVPVGIRSIDSQEVLLVALVEELNERRGQVAKEDRF